MSSIGNAEQYEISIVKGDTLDLKLSIIAENGEIYEPEPSDIITFRMKEGYKATNIFYQAEVSNETLEIVIPSEITSRINAPRKYVFDVDIVLSDGRKITFIKGIINVAEKVEGRWI